MAEYVVAATVMLRRGFLRQDAALRTGEWATPIYQPAAPWTEALPGATVGFVGFRPHRLATWDRFRAFGTRGIAVTRRGDVDAVAHGLEWSGTVGDLDALLEASDVVVVSVPLTPETTGLIGAAAGTDGGRRGAGQRRRGPIVDEHAPLRGVCATDDPRRRDRRLVPVSGSRAGGVAAPSDLPFHELPNVLMDAALLGPDQQTFVARVVDITANIRRLAAGEPLANVVSVAL